MRIVFMGTPDFAVPTLAEILKAGHEVVAVYAQPPRPAGRGLREQRSPVHVFAEDAGIQVLTPKSLRTAEAQAAFAAHDADAAVVVAYGLILPSAILQAPRHGCLNLHASALPRWRGAAPIQRAIMAGDEQTAACIMRMDEGLDTGPVCARLPVPISPDMRAGELHDLLATRGAALMAQVLDELSTGTLTCTAQPEQGVTYAAKISKGEAHIDWSQPARDVHNRIRGLAPWPGAFFEVLHQGRLERVKVLRAELVEGSGQPGTVLDEQGTVACGNGAIRLLELQRAGKRAMGLAELLRGFELPAGTQLLGPAAHSN